MVMQIPVCPTCGGSKWESVEEYAGGSRHYELRPDGWTLVNSFVELLETNYCCRDCDYDPSEDEDNDELLELLNDIDTAPTDDIESDRPAEDISAILRVGCQESGARLVGSVASVG
jgi:hypothetical protein